MPRDAEKPIHYKGFHFPGLRSTLGQNSCKHKTEVSIWPKRLFLFLSLAAQLLPWSFSDKEANTAPPKRTMGVGWGGEASRGHDPKGICFWGNM